MPTESSSRDVLSAWFRTHAATLTTLDLHAPLDDLEPLREIAGDARVVAVGENAHFVEEFSLARQRAMRFLAEHFGFSVFAFEFGFSEAFTLDSWLQGDGDEADLSSVRPLPTGELGTSCVGCATTIIPASIDYASSALMFPKPVERCGQLWNRWLTTCVRSTPTRC